jgi:hypothetical protein
MPGDIFVNTIGVIPRAGFVAIRSSTILTAVVADVNENTLDAVEEYSGLSTPQRSVHFSAVLCMRSTFTSAAQHARFTVFGSYR